MRTDFDPVQVAIVVMAVIIGFVKWLWENLQQKRDSAQREMPPDPEEQRRREAAWRKQTGQSVPPPLPQSAPTPAAPSPWNELRKAWKDLQEAGKQAQAPQRSAPARTEPARRQPPVPQQQRQAARAVSAPADKPASPVMPPQVAAAAAPQIVRQNSANPMLARLQDLRHDPALMRQAILMQEILGPPKALQTSNGPAI